MTTTTIFHGSRFQKIEEGLKFILGHFNDSEPIWPRTASTRVTEGRQVVVNSPYEILKLYKDANGLDCRISAYPKYTDFYINRTGIAPSIVFAEIDKSQFETIELFESAAANTYANFQEILNSQPTQLWSGGGYHFIQPQLAVVLEREIEKFKKFGEASRKFLQFEEQLLTDNKADQRHSCTVSFRNYMLRVPFSLNSKYIQFDDIDNIISIPPEAEVRIIKSWDGTRPSIIPLLTPFYISLQGAISKDIQRRKKEELMARKYNHLHHQRPVEKKTFHWIERLLEKPLDVEGRYYCVWRIFAPYLINVKGLSRSDAFSVISSWLDKCNSLRRLSFNSVKRQKIDYALNTVANYWPISRAHLEEQNNLLYMRLKEDGIVH